MRQQECKGVPNEGPRQELDHRNQLFLPPPIVCVVVLMLSGRKSEAVDVFLLFLLCLGFWAAVPVEQNLQHDDAIAGGGDDVGEGHQRVPCFLEDNSTTMKRVGFSDREGTGQYHPHG